MRKMLFALSALMIVGIIGGCGSSKEELPVWQSNKRLLEKNTELENKVRSLEADNSRLKQQVDTLGSLPKDVRLENLYNIQSINVISTTGIYTDEKNKKPRLMVYFSPIDEDGNAIKAAGSAVVELWNIAGEPNGAMVEKWEIRAVQLKKDWGTGLMSSFYRLALDLPQNLPEKGDFVVRISFTDFLSGKILTARKSINRMNL